MDGVDPDADLSALAALEEPTRRRLYDVVAASEEPISRDEAAAALSVPRTTAAFHLERLVEEGLLEAVHVRRGSRTGPGAGRPSKLYRRSGREVNVSVPARHYALAGRLLAGAIEESGEPVRQRLEAHARRTGAALGREAGDSDVVSLLGRLGFEPRVSGSRVTLANCPFQNLAADYPSTVCGMNLSLIQGLIAGFGGLEAADWEVRLDPAPELCCVRLRAKPASGTPRDGSAA